MEIKSLLIKDTTKEERIRIVICEDCVPYLKVKTRNLYMRIIPKV